MRASYSIVQVSGRSSPGKTALLGSRLSDNPVGSEGLRSVYANKSFVDENAGQFLHLAGKYMAWIDEIGDVIMQDRDRLEKWIDYFQGESVRS